MQRAYVFMFSAPLFYLPLTTHTMAYDLDEQEQLEQFKAVWAKWGTLIMGAITVAALSVAAYNGYKYYQRSQADKAAPLFEQLEKTATEMAEDASKPKTDASTKAESEKATLVADLAKKLTEEHGNTPYAQLGALQAASAQAAVGKTAESDKLLQWVVDSAQDPEYSHLARIRLAVSMIDAKKPEQALTLLAGDAPKGFELLYADRRGDAYAANNKKTEAAAEYQKAWDLAEGNANMREIIDQKTQAIGVDLIKPAIEKTLSDGKAVPAGAAKTPA
jgi:predicted negative regulator of RcsB-dependent stress response